ncbi:hypothetical protein A6A03_02220 [Chloroflexus islandicus]|uniref:DUF4350 domain-containing protein n=1 Tax=Chloroflexus islandicus TaxID=1707952 RepID=A0A178M8C2_9CHLR|nr:hypothetical protein [Chloroflexus islandicus]OAN44992.1 hypothetical protein A6A03_02220 [Chloroflexus islandicus]
MQTKRAWRWLVMVMVLAVIGPVWLAPVAAQNADVTLTVRPAFQGFARAGTWLPVVIEVTNNGVDRTAEIVAGTPNGPFHSAIVDLPGGSRKGLTLYIHIQGAPRQLGVRVLVNGEEIATASARLQPVSEGLLVGVVGERDVRLPVLFTDGIKVTSVAFALADIPAEGLGLSPFDALILTDVAAAELAPAQRSALQAWVLRGGTLIVNGDAGISRTLASLPAELVPVTPGNLLPSISDPPLTPLALTPRNDEQHHVYPLTLPMLDSPTPLAFGQRYGDGNVVAIAFDLATPELSNWPGWRELWQTLLPSPAFIPSGMALGAKLYGAFVEENLASALTSLPALDLPSMNLLALLLGCYLIMVGPVTYLVLRRFDRLALGWVVVPAMTVIFAAIAYGAGFNLRGGDVIVSQISLIDAAEPGLARERDFIGIFSPDRSTYRLRAVGEAPLVRPITVQGPWSPGPTVNGRYVQIAPDGRVVEGLNVAQWSLQSVMLDQIVPSPGLQAQITVNGDQVQGEVINRSGQTLADVVVVYNDYLALIETLAPDEQRTVQLERPKHTFEGIMLGYLIYGPKFEESGRMGQPIPPELQLRGRILDALYGYGTGTRGAQPLVLGWYSDQRAQLELVDRRATIQRLALVRGIAQLQIVGEFTLRSGFAATIEQMSNMNSPCYAGNQIGVMPDMQPAVIRFTLPRSLQGLQVNSLQVAVRSDVFWNGRIEVYDWSQGQWEALSIDPMIQNLSAGLEQPARFLNGNGVMRVRLQRLDQGQSFSCVYVDPVIQGRMP